MATRVYLPASSAAPAISPAVGAGWTATATTGFVRIIGSKVKTATALANHVSASPSATNPGTYVMRQYVIGPLAAQTISGTLTGVIRGLESAVAHNATVAICVRQVSSTGTHVNDLLSVAASDNTGATPPELTTTAATRRFQDAAEATSLTLTSRTFTAGQYLVIEIGSRKGSTSTSTTTTLRFGDSAATDFAHTDALTTDLNPWVEFSGSIVEMRTLDGAQPAAGGAITVPSGNLPISTLSDNFNDESIGAQWEIGLMTDIGLAGGTVSVTEGADGTLQIIPSSSNYRGVVSVAAYDMSGGGEVTVRALRGTNNAQCYMGLCLGDYSSEWVRICSVGNTVEVNSGVANVWGSVSGEQPGWAVTLGNWAWWRIKENAGDLDFYTSPDGTTWTYRVSYTTPTWDLSATHVSLEGGQWGSGGEVINRFDDLVGSGGPSGPTYTRSLAGAQPTATATLTRRAAYLKTLTGAQLTATALLARRAAYLKTLTGAQPAAGGALTAIRSAQNRSVVGAQPEASGSLASRVLASRVLQGAQNAASGLLGRLASLHSVLTGAQDAASGLLARRASVRNSLTGAQPSGGGALTNDATPPSGFTGTGALLINSATAYVFRDLSTDSPGVLTTSRPATLMCWVRMDAITNQGQLFALLDETLDEDEGMWSGFGNLTDGTTIWQYTSIIDPDHSTFYSPNAGLGVWRHMAWVIANPGIIYGYFDGISQGDLGATATMVPRVIAIGIGNGFTQHIMASVGQARCWNVALTQAEVQAEMVSATAVKTSGLYGDWPLVSDLVDASGNGHPFASPATATFISLVGPPDVTVAGAQDAASGTLVARLAAVRAVAGAQPTPTGVLSRLLRALRTVVGAQLAPTGALARRHAAFSALVGAQPYPTALLARRAATKNAVVGAQGAPSGALSAVPTGSLARALVGSQPYPTGALTRRAATTLTLAGAQPYSTAALSAAEVAVAGPNLPAGGPSDDFNDGVLSAATWHEVHSGPYAMTESGGTLNFTVTGSGTGAASIRSNSAYNMIDRSARIELVQLPSGGVTGSQLRVSASGHGFGSSHFYFGWDAGNMVAGYSGFAGGSIDLVNVAWPSGARWLRIGFDVTASGKVWFDYSVDGATWEPAGSMAAPTPAIDLSALSFGVHASRNGVGSVQWDNLNPIPARVLDGAQPSGSGTLVLHGTFARPLTGEQPFATGLLGARKAALRALLGAQLPASGALARLRVVVRSLSGAQPTALGTLAYLMRAVRALTGAQAGPSGALQRTLNVRIALVGSQPAATASLARTRIRGLLATQPAASGTLVARSIRFRDLPGFQPAPSGHLMFIPPLVQPDIVGVPLVVAGVAYSQTAPIPGTAVLVSGMPDPPLAVGTARQEVPVG